jgi:hypothetical protein
MMLVIEPKPIPLVSMRLLGASIYRTILSKGMKLYKALGCVVDAYSYIPSTLCPGGNSRATTERSSYC